VFELYLGTFLCGVCDGSFGIYEHCTDTFIADKSLLYSLAFFLNINVNNIPKRNNCDKLYFLFFIEASFIYTCYVFTYLPSEASFTLLTNVPSFQIQIHHACMSSNCVSFIVTSAIGISTLHL